MSGHCASDVSQGYRTGSRNVARNVAKSIEEMSSKKPHGLKSFERPVLHKEIAIDTSAILQKQNIAFVVVCAGEFRSQVDFVNTSSKH